MKTMKLIKGLMAVMGATLFGLSIATIARAANPETVTAQVTFADPVTITTNLALRYGIIDQNLNTETIIIGTDDSVGGTGIAFVLGGTQGAASLDVSSESGQTLTILIDNIVNGTGYSLGSFVCNYDTGTDTACNSYTPLSTGANKTLLIGATLTGDNTAVPGPANGSFRVTIAYQ